MEQHGLFRLTKASLVVSNGGLWDDIIPLHSLPLPVSRSFSFLLLCWRTWWFTWSVIVLYVISQQTARHSCSYHTFYSTLAWIVASYLLERARCKSVLRSSSWNSFLSVLACRPDTETRVCSLSTLTCQHNLSPLDTNKGNKCERLPLNLDSILKIPT